VAAATEGCCRSSHTSEWTRFVANCRDLSDGFLRLESTSSPPLQSLDSRVGSGLSPSHPASLVGPIGEARHGVRAELRPQLLHVPWQHTSYRCPQPALSGNLCLRQRLSCAAYRDPGGRNT